MSIPPRTRQWRERIGYAIRTIALRQKRPFVMGLMLTDQCNLDCFYCEGKNKGRHHYDWTGASAALRDGYGRGHRSLYVTGGEPVLWHDGRYTLKDLVALAVDLGFHDVLIATNGTYPFDIPGCRYVVTLDGPEPVHDSIRSGTYQQILSHAREARRGSLYATMTVSRTNAAHVEEFVEETTRLGLFRAILFNLLTHWREVLQTHGLEGQERRELLDRIWRLKRAGYPIVLSRAAYRALRNNNWRRPVEQMELYTQDRRFTCCRDVDHPEICQQCGYFGCAEVSQALALRPSAAIELLRWMG